MYLLSKITTSKQKGHTQASIALTLKQCKIKGSNLDVGVMKAKNIFPMGQVQVDVLFTVTTEKWVHMEYLIYDGIGMFGSIGGSLGLFVGFSLYDSICLIIDSVYNMIKIK